MRIHFDLSFSRRLSGFLPTFVFLRGTCLFVELFPTAAALPGAAVEPVTRCSQLLKTRAGSTGSVVASDAFVPFNAMSNQQTAIGSIGHLCQSGTGRTFKGRSGGGGERIDNGEQHPVRLFLGC